ncbi:MAG: hypothetical protein ABI200_00340 [Gaiellales bacterium]
MTRSLMILLMITAALVAGGCRKVVSQPVLEQVVADLLLTVSGVEVNVDCPANRTMRIDNDFFCHTEHAGRHGFVLVRQIDDYGHVELVNVKPLARTKIEPIVERYLQRQHGLDASVTCPKDIIQDPDVNFRCRIDGTNEQIEVRQVDGIRRYSFNYTPAAEQP